MNKFTVQKSFAISAGARLEMKERIFDLILKMKKRY
jgi:hypothetical protein